MSTKTTSNMELTIMPAGKKFKSTKLLRILENRIALRRIFARHMNNWDERMLDKCEDLTVRPFIRKRNCKAVSSKDCRNNEEQFRASCNNKIKEIECMNGRCM